MTDIKTGAELHLEHLTKQKIVKAAMIDLELRKWCVEKAVPFAAPAGGPGHITTIAQAIYIFITKD